MEATLQNFLCSKDNYIAKLHEGERVLTKGENKDYTQNIKPKTGNIYNINITANNSEAGVDWNKIAELIIKKFRIMRMKKRLLWGLYRWIFQ